MQFPSQIQRSASPTLSDGTKSKRPLVIDEKSNKKEKIQKVRRLDSPTSPTDKNYVQVPSPQYSTADLGKASPKTLGDKRSVSPKAMYPPSIQKYLNGKSNITIEEAVEKLKSPTNKTHKGNLEKMKLLGMLQTQEIESNIMFRKAYSNSTTSVSPAHSGSPIGSPKINATSPKEEHDGGNIVMTFEESYPSLSPHKMMSGGNMSQNNNWNSGMMGNNGNNFPFGQAQQQGFFNNSYPNQMGNSNNNNNNFMNQGNFMGFQGQNGQYNQSQQGIQFNQFNQNQGFYNNSTQGQGMQNNNNNFGSNFEQEETRDRTTSFLMDSGNLGFMNQQNMSGGSDTKWMVQNQINTIQSLVSHKKTTISPSEPNRGLVQMFQKRNSNPENTMRSPMQSNLFSQKNQSMGNNMMQGFNNNGQGNLFMTGGGMAQEQPNNNQGFENYNNMGLQLNPHQLQQKLIETGMVEAQNQGMGMQGQNQGLGFGFNNEGNNQWNNDLFNNNNNNNNGGMIGEKIEENPDSFDPASYFALQNSHKEHDFDMNIIQSDVGFIPHGKSFDGLEEQLVLPDMGLEGLLNNPYGGYKFGNN